MKTSSVKPGYFDTVNSTWHVIVIADIVFSCSLTCSLQVTFATGLHMMDGIYAMCYAPNYRPVCY